MRLVDNAKQAWKWFSVQALAAVALIPLVWQELPYEAQAIVPAEWRPWALAAVAVSGLVGRLVDQGSKEA
jgi:hypothetical protein